MEMEAITREQLNRAGWVSIVDAVLSIPLLILVLLLEHLAERGGGSLKVLEIGLTLISTGMGIYVLLALKKLLNWGYQFYDVNTYISVLIWSSVIFAILDILPLDGGLETAIVILVGIAAVVLGIVIIVFAIKLLRLPDDLFGFLKGYCYFTIASGFCLATIILTPIALITSAVASIILGIIFFRATEKFYPTT